VKLSAFRGAALRRGSGDTSRTLPTISSIVHGLAGTGPMDQAHVARLLLVKLVNHRHRLAGGARPVSALPLITA
jgi:hypothetical protein